jgi:urease accessory protein UreF
MKLRTSQQRFVGRQNWRSNHRSRTTAAVRLIPLGQTSGQLAIAELQKAVLATAFLVDLASGAHETQYTRLFRS